MSITSHATPNGGSHGEVPGGAGTLVPSTPAAGGPAVTSTNDNTNLEQLLIVFRRRWKLLLACIVCAGAAAVGLSLVQQKKYTAASSLLFSNAQFDQELFGSNFTPYINDPTQQQATNIDLVSLPVVAQRTATALHLTSGEVTSEVSVSQTGQANIAQISVTDPSPARAALIANTYARQFVLYRRDAERAQIAGAQALVQKELAALSLSQKNGNVGTSLQNRNNQLGVLAALQTGDAQVAQPASIPMSPSTPNTKRNAALGLLLGLLIGMGLIFVAERLDRRIRGPKELEEAYGIPVLGIIPESHAYEVAGAERLPTVEAEAFALLRARLRYFNVDREVRSLLMTSSVPGEGKTTVALNLAIAEAVAGNGKVVLLEADMRRPSLATRLGLTPAPGLSEILSRNTTLESALRTVAVPGRSDNGKESDSGSSFTVITAGAIPPNPAELMESRAMIDLLSTLSERFDLVVVDTAPTSAVSDAIPVLRLVSGVVVVNRVDAVTRDSARHLREHLAKLHAPVLGVVANAMPAKGRGYYGHGYGYGYGYGYGNPYLEDGDGDGRGSVRQNPVAGSPAPSSPSD